MGVQAGDGGRLLADPETFLTPRPGVFAAGDAARGPNTVVEAIADGKKAAVVIGQYLRGEPLRPPSFARRPGVYIEQPVPGQKDLGPSGRATPRHLPAESRAKGFAEVESPLSAEEATREAGRCLRCDLEFTRPAENDAERLSPGDKKAWSH
jgi:NADH-quinone oxidoreductase subunit F